MRTSSSTSLRQVPRPARWACPGRAAALAATFGLVVACGYVPPRFSDRPPVWQVADDRPITLPRRRRFTQKLYYSDAYVRRELVGALDPARTPYAVDVNALDEVPRSAWYRGVANTRDPLAGYQRDGPPVAPFRPSSVRSAAAIEGAWVVTDARGLRYELQSEVPGRSEMRSAAAAICSRLVWALGYRTPEVWIARAPDGERVSATRWPPGVDLGPTLVTDTRSDDPNDVLSHVDRRTLRVLGMVAAWLRFGRLDPQMIRDVYVGPGGRGHVQHQLLGFGNALGVDALLEVEEQAADPDRQDTNFFYRLATLGLSPKPPAPQAQSRWLSLGQLDERVVPDDYRPSPPYEPLDRLIGADAYWLAKRLGEVSGQTIDRAVRAGQLSSAQAEHRLGLLLRARRLQVIAFGFGQTTPAEVVRVAARPGGAPRLLLVDLAIGRGLASNATSRYDVSFLDSDGAELAPPVSVRPNGSSVAVPLPRQWAEGSYLVVRASVVRGEIGAPRPLEVHLLRDQQNARILGVRH